MLFTGTEGKVEVNWACLKTRPENLKEVQISTDQIHLYESNNHHADWLGDVRTGSKPICSVEIGTRLVTVCHLGNIAYQPGCPLRWNPEAERSVGDEDPNRFLDRAKRSPWRPQELRRQATLADRVQKNGDSGAAAPESPCHLA